jgi:hypothetical protein
MDEHTQPQAAHAAAPKEFGINFAAVFATLLANPEVRAWLHQMLDTALDKVKASTQTQTVRGPEGTVIWGSDQQTSPGQ